MIKISINYQQSDITIDIEETKTFTDVQDILENRTGIGLLVLYNTDHPDNIINMELSMNQIYPDTLIINLIALLPYFELTDVLINKCKDNNLSLDVLTLKELAPKIPFERYIWTAVTNYDYLFCHTSDIGRDNNDLILLKEYRAEIESTFYLMDTSNGTSFKYTFAHSTYKLNGVMNWDLSKGINFSGMFYYSKMTGHNIIDDPIDLNKLIIPNNKHITLNYICSNSKIKSSISDWDISKVINI
jgi:hypothetical protein